MTDPKPVTRHQLYQWRKGLIPDDMVWEACSEDVRLRRAVYALSARRCRNYFPTRLMALESLTARLWKAYCRADKARDRELEKKHRAHQ